MIPKQGFLRRISHQNPSRQFGRKSSKHKQAYNQAYKQAYKQAQASIEMLHQERQTDAEKVEKIGPLD
jgi:hypothetical protein